MDRKTRKKRTVGHGDDANRIGRNSYLPLHQTATLLRYGGAGSGAASQDESTSSDDLGSSGSSSGVPGDGVESRRPGANGEKRPRSNGRRRSSAGRASAAATASAAMESPDSSSVDDGGDLCSSSSQSWKRILKKRRKDLVHAGKRIHRRNVPHDPAPAPPRNYGSVDTTDESSMSMSSDVPDQVGVDEIDLTKSDLDSLGDAPERDGTNANESNANGDTRRGSSSSTLSDSTSLSTTSGLHADEYDSKRESSRPSPPSALSTSSSSSSPAAAATTSAAAAPASPSFRIVASVEIDILEDSKRMRQIRAFVETIVTAIRQDRADGKLPSAKSGPCRGKLAGYLPRTTLEMAACNTGQVKSAALYLKDSVDRWLVEFGDIEEPDDDDYLQLIRCYEDSLNARLGIGSYGKRGFIDDPLYATTSEEDDSSSTSSSETHDSIGSSELLVRRGGDRSDGESIRRLGMTQNRDGFPNSRAGWHNPSQATAAYRKRNRKRKRTNGHRRNGEKPQARSPREALFHEKVGQFHVPNAIRERMDTWEYYYERLEEMEKVSKALVAANHMSSEYHLMLQDDELHLDRGDMILTWQQKQECIVRYLAFLMQAKVSYVQQMVSDHFEERRRCRLRERRQRQRQNRNQAQLTADGGIRHQLNKASYAEIYEDTMSSFRLFCPICLEYCCSQHGILPESDPIHQMHLAKKRHEIRESEAGGMNVVTATAASVVGATSIVPSMLATTPAPARTMAIGNAASETSDCNNSQSSLQPRNKTAASFPRDQTLTEEQITTCQSLWYLFDGNLAKIAEATRIPLSIIEQRIKFLPLPEVQYTLEHPKETKSKKKNRKNHYHCNMAKYCQEIGQRPHPFPCNHVESGLCTLENCTCMQNGFFCTRRCCFAEFSPNFFRGCTCNARCDNNQCPCFAAKRECDPNLCRACGACSERAGRPIMTQQCRNDNITMRRHPLLSKGESDVPGANFGCFAMETIRRGQFVDSYKGELLSQNKADDLGNKVYDEINNSYIFDLTSDMVIDAFRMGNMARWINHDGQTYNVQPDTWFVQGDPKIALYANRNIKKQEELFFDYGDKFHGHFLPREREKGP